MQKLAEFPGIGHLREDVTDEPIRFWCVYSYLIAYRPHTKPLEILRIVHGARDLGPLFRRKRP
jgi:antitoxin ParD1/3/4/toxin ParE1/3/4